MRWLLLATTVIGCAPPTETRRAIAAERAPILPEPEEDEPATLVLHRGDVVAVGRAVPKIAWKGSVEGTPAARNGEMVEVKRSDGETAAYAFAEDVGPSVTMPAAAWLCGKMAAPAPCATRLRRILLDGGALLAFDPCGIGACRVAVVHGARVSALSVDGLADLVAATVEGRAVALAQTRWVKAPAWTGSTTMVFTVGDCLERALSIPIEEIDARSSPTIQRMGRLDATGGTLIFRGTRRVISATGEVASVTPAVESYHLAKTP